MSCRYPWGQQPLAYIAAWKLVHNALANLTCSVTMVWAPNTAIGYPWRVQDRTEECAPGACSLLVLLSRGQRGLARSLEAPAVLQASSSQSDPFAVSR